MVLPSPSHPHVVSTGGLSVRPEWTTRTCQVCHPRRPSIPLLRRAVEPRRPPPQSGPGAADRRRPPARACQRRPLPLANPIRIAAAPGAAHTHSNSKEAEGTPGFRRSGVGNEFGHLRCCGKPSDVLAMPGHLCRSSPVAHDARAPGPAGDATGCQALTFPLAAVAAIPATAAQTDSWITQSKPIAGATVGFGARPEPESSPMPSHGVPGATLLAATLTPLPRVHLEPGASRSAHCSCCGDVEPRRPR